MRGCKLFVGNLSFSVTQEQLNDLFSECGEVASVKIIESRGFGFVEMASQADAQKAKEALNDKEVDGRRLKVDEAHEPQKKQGQNFRRRY